MKNTPLFSVLFLILSISSGVLFAGSSNVRFGAYTAGQGCSGTGICQSGTTGANVIFDYHEVTDSAAGGAIATLIMTFNYVEAKRFGFIGSAEGGTYSFNQSYTFDHPGDKDSGVPADYTIQEGTNGTMMPVDAKGVMKIVFTQFRPYRN
jgi:hypothetical protein